MQLNKRQLHILHYLQAHTKSLEVVFEREDDPNQAAQAAYILGRLVGEMGNLTEEILPIISDRLAENSQ